MTTRALVDANILVYYLDAREGRKHQLAQEFMKEVDANPLKFVVCIQSLREFASIATKKSIVPAVKIKESVMLFEKAFQKPLGDIPFDIMNAVSLACYQKIPFYDALLASTAQRHGVTTIYTENTKDFEKILGIKAVNPLK
jgi:predicted nucleic acid-binding protein